MGATVIQGANVTLRPVTDADVTPDYVGWMNDPEVGAFLETRFAAHSADDVRKYVRTQNAAADAVFLAIVRNADQRHIGNLRIGAIDRHHHTATIALVIGDKTAWGHGLGSEAIALATTHAFSALGLRKLNARCYATNLGSIRAFEKAGWTHEGRQASQFETAGGRVDGVWLGIERA
jgi:[ribosomal protein S5]-alanine N-acetyltransferase